MKPNFYNYYNGHGWYGCAVIDEGRKYIRVLSGWFTPRIIKIEKKIDQWDLKEVPLTKKNNAKRYIKFMKRSWNDSGKKTVSKEVKELLMGRI